MTNAEPKLGDRKMQWRSYFLFLAVGTLVILVWQRENIRYAVGSDTTRKQITRDRVIDWQTGIDRR